ncbi:hypothetical protein SASPL_100551 [Salvia splendens]|uniref:Nucleoplasmin-like domain-containing protein n=1 Tax=Salvia splendens TaxID=180675 RepID=A0A8X8YSW4_SALSN|nr:hypothetical protein SASPL_100551 [Salvia splendens]
MDAILPIIAFSVIAGAVIAFVVFGAYSRKRKSEIKSITPPEILNPNPKPTSKPSAVKKPQHKSHSHSHAADKDANKKHHHLDLNTLKGHGDAVTGLSFSPDGRSLATACGDGVVRIFRLDDASSKSFKFLRINLPAGGHPNAVAFAGDASSIVVASQALSGSSLYMYEEEKPKTTGDQKQQSKLPLPEIKWEHHKVHDKRAIITLVGAKTTYGSADGNAFAKEPCEAISLTALLRALRPVCTDIILWHGKTGKPLGNVDTNQLKNTMATISPNGRFIAAAAFTADVKVWEVMYSKDGSVKEVLKAMQLKGHKSAVTWLCFSPNSEQIITASKDGTIRIWNINVRYHMDEDPKTLKVLPIPLHDENGTTLHYDLLSLSPDGKILAATHGSTLQWLCAETGQVLDVAEKAHDDQITYPKKYYDAGDITDMAWAPSTILMDNKQTVVLATASNDKKVKLWQAPLLKPSFSYIKNLPQFSAMLSVTPIKAIVRTMLARKRITRLKGFRLQDSQKVTMCVEVKPGKPITHSCEKAAGRLRISQATLGFGESSKSSVLQCNVGNRSPVLLCVLLPGRMESSHIELEFEEADDVVFSVVGPRSVYLTGYYVRQSGHSNGRSDTYPCS